MRFKTFLEAAVNSDPQYIPLQAEDALKELKTHCKDSLWMIEDDAPLYRGEREKLPLKSGYVTVDSSATERQSENTSNYYTVILDNLSSMKDFPKRSRSFIASSTTNRLTGYSYKQYSNDRVLRKTLTLIPYDSAEIGVVGKPDMWETKISLFGKRNEIADVNSLLFSRICKNDKGMSIRNITWDQFVDCVKKFETALIEKSEDALFIFKDFFEFDYSPKYNEILKEIERAYSPQETGFKAYTPSTLPRYLAPTEVWVGGKVMLISEDVWSQLRTAL